MILTDAGGHPLEQPEQPEPGSLSPAEFIAWCRAQNAARDRAAAIANAAFDRALRSALRNDTLPRRRRK